MRQWIGRNLVAREFDDGQWFVEAMFNDYKSTEFTDWLDQNNIPRGSKKTAYYFWMQWHNLTTDQVMLLKLAWGGR